MPKNIVICCDGTGNEFGTQKSNVVKLYKMLICDSTQTTYYHPGLGTIGARNALTAIGKWWTRLIGLAFGYGISDNIADAYQFLMRTYEKDDHIYIFGFSRGAYTARALAGMLHTAGLLTQGNEGLIPYAIRMIKRKNIDFGLVADFKKTFSRKCQIHFLGVWDTVSSVGWVYNAVRFPGTKATHNADLRTARHAVSVDERRAFFRQNLLGDPHDEGQDISEVWFAGVHSDVGGGYPEPESQLSKCTLRWIVCEAELSGLKVDSQRKADILGGKPPYVAPDPLTLNQHESLHGWWWIAELWPKLAHREVAPDQWRSSLYVNMGRRRKINDDIQVHESVAMRLDGEIGYHPKNLPEQREVVTDRCAGVPMQ